MENASKALLIAGAILLVIAIIAIAVGIVSKTKGTIGSAENQIDSMAIRIHNNQFEGYDGIGIPLKKAKELLSIIANNNSSAKTDDFKVIVHEYLQVSTDNKKNYEAGYEYTADFIDNAYNQYSSAYFTGKPIDLPSSGGQVNKGNTFNIKMIYNEKGLIDRVDFYRYYI